MFRTDLYPTAASEYTPLDEHAAGMAPEPMPSKRVADMAIGSRTFSRPQRSHEKPVPERSELEQLDREALYEDFQPLVRRLIRQYGETPELRQDLAGEIYCRFCDLLNAYDPSRGIPLRPYLVRTLTASVYTYSRSQWRRQHREVSLQTEVEVENAGEHVDPSHQWDRELITNEILATLPASIAKLPLRQRQVVIWRYYESRSFDEIAETLRIRPATARSLLRHGLNNLRNMIAGNHRLADW